VLEDMQGDELMHDDPMMHELRETAVAPNQLAYNRQPLQLILWVYI